MFILRNGVSYGSCWKFSKFPVVVVAAVDGLEVGFSRGMLSGLLCNSI